MSDTGLLRRQRRLAVFSIVVLMLTPPARMASAQDLNTRLERSRSAVQKLRSDVNGRWFAFTCEKTVTDQQSQQLKWFSVGFTHYFNDAVYSCYELTRSRNDVHIESVQKEVLRTSKFKLASTTGRDVDHTITLETVGKSSRVSSAARADEFDFLDTFDRAFTSYLNSQFATSKIDSLGRFCVQFSKAQIRRSDSGPASPDIHFNLYYEAEGQLPIRSTAGFQEQSDELLADRRIAYSTTTPTLPLRILAESTDKSQSKTTRLEFRLSEVPAPDWFSQPVRFDVMSQGVLIVDGETLQISAALLPPEVQSSLVFGDESAPPQLQDRKLKSIARVIGHPPSVVLFSSAYSAKKEVGSLRFLPRLRTIVVALLFLIVLLMLTWARIWKRLQQRG